VAAGVLGSIIAGAAATLFAGSLIGVVVAVVGFLLFAVQYYTPIRRFVINMPEEERSPAGSVIAA
jgi:hypothetical protein